jgi:hypothetical protein
MSGHAPGPWSLVPGHSIVKIVAADGSHVANTSGAEYWENFKEADLANARLIAAAPEMLAALKELIGWRGPMDMMPPEVRGSWLRAEAAIAKATKVL